MRLLVEDLICRLVLSTSGSLTYFVTINVIIKLYTILCIWQEMTWSKSIIWSVIFYQCFAS